MTASKSLFVTLALSCAGLAQNASAAYVYQTLALPGSTYNDVRGINDQGQLVGYSDVGNGGYAYANGVYSALATPPAGTSYVNALAINNAGTVVGAIYGATSSESSFALRNGVYTTFSHPGYTNTEARAIGNGGLISGIAFNDASTLGIGFIYNPASATFTDVTAPAGTSFLISQGVNSAGQQVGSFHTATTTVSYLRQADGTTTTFDIGGVATNARALNDNGLIAGWLSSGASFVGNSSGYQLLSVPGAMQTVAEGINNAGQVVGLWYSPTDYDAHAFIATPAQLPVGTTANGGYAFDTAVIADVPLFIDPLVAVGYDYAIGAGDPDFATVMLPIGVGDGIYTLTVGGQSFVVAGGDLFDFRQHGFGDGVDAFEVTGIETSAGLDPASSGAFVTQLSFVGTGRFTGSQTPLVAAVAVPEPETLALLTMGMLALGLSRRRRHS